jgi:hypothetical protein
MRGAPGYRNVPMESDWASDPDAFEYASTRVRVALDWLRPEGKALPQTSNIAKGHAEMMMRDIAEAPEARSGDPQSWARVMRGGLRPERMARGKARWEASRQSPKKESGE